MKNNYIGSLLNRKPLPFSDLFKIDESGRVTLKKKILVYDLETTGIDPVKDDITQIAYTIFSEKFEVIKEYNKYFKLREKTFEEIDPEIVRKTKITKELLENGGSIESGIGDFLRDGEDCIIASYNGWGFGDKFITSKVYKYIQVPFWPTLFASDIDVFILAIGALFGEIGNFKLSSIVKSQNIEFNEETAHNAQYDVNMTAAIIPGLVRKLATKYEDFFSLNRYIEQKRWYRYWRFERYEEPWLATEKQKFFANKLMKETISSKGMKGPLEWLSLTVVEENEVTKLLKNNNYDFISNLSKIAISDVISFILWFREIGVKVS